MKDEEPENGQPLPDLEPQEQRAVEIRLLEYCAEDLAESTGFSKVFERTKQMPHYRDVRSSWENACANFQYTKFVFKEEFPSKLRRQLANDNDAVGVRILDALNAKSRGRPKADPKDDFNLLRAWLHCGVWMLNHDDRALFMELLFPHETSLGADALRKQGKRLGLLGYNNFRTTYRRAPLSFFDRDRDKVIFKLKGISPNRGWKIIPPLLFQVKLSAPLS